MTSRLVADELDLNLATLTAALIVIVVVVVGGRALSLDAAVLVVRVVAIAHRVRVVQVRGRRLVVLVGDVGHCREGNRGCNCDGDYKLPMPILIRIQSSSTCITRRWKRQRVVEILL